MAELGLQSNSKLGPHHIAVGHNTRRTRVNLLKLKQTTIQTILLKMHPSIALQAAERELEGETRPGSSKGDDDDRRWQEMQLRRPATFIHFAPRWHQQRRTMTGVLAGYFDPPPGRNVPLPTIPGAQLLLARTAAPAVTEEELERMELENRKRRRGRPAHSKRGQEVVTITDLIDQSQYGADHTAGVVVAEDPRRGGRTGREPSATNRSSSRSRSDSPLTTDFKGVSDESTPPLTPMSSRSEGSYRLLSDEEKANLAKNKNKADGKKAKRSSNKPLPIDEALIAEIREIVSTGKNAARGGNGTGENLAGTNAGGNSSASKKRKFAEMERSLQRARGAPNPASNATPMTQEQKDQAAEQQRQRRKSRPGWKGWVEVEGSPEPMTKLINLDFPIETLEKRTRSGKIVPPSGDSGVAPTSARIAGRGRARPSIPRSSTGASSTPAPIASSEGGGSVDGPLGAISGNTVSVSVNGGSGAEV